MDGLSLDERSERLSGKVDALARALRDAGVAPETAARLLETAATAALHALTLELLLAPVPSASPALVEELPVAEQADVAAAA
jgi:hypothetical protein